MSDSYFASEKIEVEEKQERILQLAAAFREGLAKGVGNSLNVTYAKAFDVLRAVDSKLFSDIGKFYDTQKQLPSVVQEFIGQDNPLKSVQAEIDMKGKALLNIQPGNQRRALERRIKRLQEAQDYFALLAGGKSNPPQTVSLLEQDALQRDFMIAQREVRQYRALTVTADRYREYSLPNGHLMRIRFLHNLPPEHVTGVDLVYEQIDIKHNTARFAHLQYKMWNGRKLTLSSPRELRQLERIHNTFCGDKQFCNDRGSGHLPYRFPFCAAFYRPTHKKQMRNAQHGTTGIHIPACLVHNYSNPPISIEKEVLYSQGITHSVFDELFRNGLVGSAWLDIATVEEFYKVKKILDSEDTMVLNIRQESGHSQDRMRDAEPLRDLFT